MARLFVALTLLVGTPLSLLAEPLETSVLWADDTGEDGVALFEGTMDSDSLDGTLDFGSDSFQVTGTVDAQGAVDGTVTTNAGQPVMTFETTAVGSEVAGEYTVTGTEGGVWVTETAEPAQGIPDVPD
jgi:hypothetical protein